MGGFPQTPLVPQTVSSCSKTTILRTCTQGEYPLGKYEGFCVHNIAQETHQYVLKLHWENCQASGGKQHIKETNYLLPGLGPT